ncbi:MAG: TOBE domain-containing protein [Rubritepida sp.]|nr:TOBE domain-containing protein [Rubritepida sp.]
MSGRRAASSRASWARRTSSRRAAGCPSTNGVAARVEEVAFRGADTLLLARPEGAEPLRVLLPAGAPLPASGDRVALAWEAAALAPLAR